MEPWRRGISIGFVLEAMVWGREFSAQLRCVCVSYLAWNQPIRYDVNKDMMMGKRDSDDGNGNRGQVCLLAFICWGNGFFMPILKKLHGKTSEMTRFVQRFICKISLDTVRQCMISSARFFIFLSDSFINYSFD